ncbi:hypothetical protein [Cetobacterium sp.]|uniref:hypothetical protein n=1 Tax=Cetobacterium sp. TaxID=2071632 RepID=UPI003F3FA3CE
MIRKITVSESKLVSLFKISERTVRELYSEARIRPGTYDFREVIELYISRQTLTNIDLEIKEIDKKTKILKLEILEGKYHKVEDVTKAVTDMLANFKSKMTSLPVKLSGEILDVKDRLGIEKILRDGINEALLELTEYKVNLEDEDEEDYS